MLARFLHWLGLGLMRRINVGPRPCRLGRPRTAAHGLKQQGSHYAAVSASATPPSALTVTTNSGGARQATSSTNPTNATAKSAGVFTEVVHTGL